MPELSWIIAAFFLPLFPQSMVFNALFQRLPNIWMRVMLVLIWPLPGVWILQGSSADMSQWIVIWALFSAALYGFRAVVVREFFIWIGFIATSSWALAWVALASGVASDDVVLHLMAFSLPLALLILLATEVEKRYGSAYVGVVSGLAMAQPKLSGLLVFATLAAIGSPLFPAFFSMLDTISHAVGDLVVIASGVVFVWLLWSWSGVQLLQELLVGSDSFKQIKDLSYTTTLTYGFSLVLLVMAGIYVSKELL